MPITKRLMTCINILPCKNHRGESIYQVLFHPPEFERCDASVLVIEDYNKERYVVDEMYYITIENSK